MEPQTLQAEVRQKGGKGPARQLRMRGLIPAIFYGPAKDPVKLQLSPKSLERALSGAYGRNQVIELVVGDTKELTIVKDLEVDPVTRQILHADFYSVAKDRAVLTTVPFESKGRALGVQKGAVMRKLFRDLPIRAFPQDVPSAITLDVAPLDMGAVVRVEDLKLPEGVEVTFAPNRRVLIIEAKERAKVEEEEETAAAAPGAAAPAG